MEAELTSENPAVAIAVGAPEIRTARADDAGPIAELMYSAGPEVFDFLYSSGKHHALDFIRHEFRSGIGFCGYNNVTVVVKDGVVVATGCFYGRTRFNELSAQAAKSLLNFYGLLGNVPVLLRSRHIGSIMKPPKEDELYLANFAVEPAFQGQGIGTQLIRYKLAEARQLGYRLFGLDVAVTNPRGQALYERLGLRVTREKVFTGDDPKVPACRKMELSL